MATVRESSFMPTIKCSSCNREIAISMMGEHVCSGSAAPEAAPATSFFSRLINTSVATTAASALVSAAASATNVASALSDKQGRAPPSLDMSAANRPYTNQADLTPETLSAGSPNISPRTPNGRTDFGRNDGYFSPQIAGNSPRGGLRPGGYGGLGDNDAYNGENDSRYSGPNSPKRTAPNLSQRIQNSAPGPFEAGRRGRNAFAPAASEDAAPEFGRYGGSPPDTTDDRGGSMPRRAPSRAPRKNGYGEFDAPRTRPESNEPEMFGQGGRAATFPRPSGNMDPPARPPSAPGNRSDRFGRASQDSTGQSTQGHVRKPSRLENRTPPPRLSLLSARRVGKDGLPAVPAINLAEEFGAGNPYHSPSGSTSSNLSVYSNSIQPSQASSQSSPARSARSGKEPADTSNFDSLMADLQVSIDQSNHLPVSPALSPMKDSNRYMAPAPRSRPPPAERTYDARVDPAIQSGRSRARSPLASPDLMGSPPLDMSFRNDPAVQGGRDVRRPPPTGAYSSSQLSSSWERQRGPQRSNTAPPEQIKARSPSRNRQYGTTQPSRGDCKSCGLRITGKSISSADGRLTGRYHKACFVCTTCSEPFTSSTFYVLDDKPYCERHYHKLNGSLCGSCGDGIEGQYLEDEASTKYHPGCFRCGDCGKVLNDGYFEVNGAAYCEKDAWKRVQTPPSNPLPRNGSRRSPLSGPSLGLPTGPRGGGMGMGLPSNNRLGPPRLRMEKRMTRLGMM